MATKKASAEVTASVARDLLDYEPRTGGFTRRSTGRRADTKHNAGYLCVSVCGRLYLSHRLAWLYVHGEWPADQIDHINGDRADNRINNLRECTNAQNCQNVRAHRDGCGLLGASLEKRSGRWQSGIGVGGKRFHLGYFATKEEAHAAYLEAKQNLHCFGAFNV